MTINNRNNRRGVTLLVVLGLMTMFAMLVTAFMVITTQARRTAESSANALIDNGNSDGGHSAFSTDFNPVIEKLLIGGLDNVIGPYSILENLYGHPNFTNGSGETKNLEGTFNGTPSGTDYIKVSYSLLLPTPPPSSVDYDTYQENDLIGSVITITGAGKSTFIIGNDGTNLILARNGILDTEITGGFIINSPAFSGTGPGFNPGAVSGAAALTVTDEAITAATGDIDFGETSGKPLALRPNILAPESDGKRPYRAYLENNLVLMNPDYTAPDYQNMFLAWNDVQDSGLAPPDPKWKINSVIPSFHRPQLLKYWEDVAQGAGTSIYSDPNELRKIVLRPLPTDHPNFTGSNPAAKSVVPADLENFLTAGPWDVDNDGDGIADGIWLDLGFAPVADPRSGKIYKKLVSYYVLDMDGRLNVNVHGNPDQITAEGSTNDLFGSGSGPAEVRLDLGLDLIKENRFAQLIDGEGSETGRYGAGNTPGDDNITTDAGLTWDNYKLMGINPLAYGYTDADITINGTSVSPAGGMIPDLRGETPVTFDTFGNRNLGSSGTIYAQNPYLLNPYKEQESADDSPFTQNELQYLIRSVGDTDYTQLSKRIRNLLNEKETDTPSSKYFLSQYRLLLGTRSSDIPVFSRFGGATTGSGAKSYQGLYDYILNRICGGTTADADKIWPLLPEEIRRGEKVNLNRLTLRNDWTNVDPATSSDLLQAKAKFAQEIYYLLCVLCYDQIKNGNLGGADSTEQAYTRLAQWSVNLVDFIDPDATMTPFVFSTDPYGSGIGFDNTSLISKVIDNTLDITSDSDWTTDVRLIWGMEKPEVALTKTFATHNRRVADSSHDIGGNDAIHTSAGHTGGGAGCDKNFNRINSTCTNTTCTNTAHGYDTTHKHDESFDQVLAPEGSLFVEIYRQGNLNRITYPGDLEIDTATKELNLAQTVTGGTDYVWRLAIGEKAKDNPTAGTPVPKNDIFKELSNANKGSTYSFQPQQWKADAGDSALIGTSTEGCEIIPERFIWFGPAPATSLTGTEINFYNADTTTNPLLEPNEYLVIGPRTETSFLSKQVDDDPVTMITDDISDDNYALHFGIPNKGPASAPTKDTYINLDELIVSGTPVKTMIAEASPNVGVSITEPKNGYTGTFPQDVPYTDTNFPEADGLGTITGYKAIFLQRLADPTRDHNSVTNPYITVDWNMIDLHVINSERDKNGLEYTEANDISMAFKEDLKFAIRQWGYSNWKTPTSSNKPDDPNIWDRSFDADETDWEGPDAAKFNAESQNGADLIWGYRAKGIADADSFVHFPWHDAPLANTYELMLVPATTPGRFGFEFHDHTGDWANASSPSLGSSGMRFASTDGTVHGVSPYLNFFASGTTSTSLDLSRLFEYVRVPSKFAGTISGWTGTNPDTPIYAMREPGKINLNTATEPAWEALSGNSGRDAWHNYNDTANNNGLYDLRNSGIGGTDPSEFVPFRSPQAVNLVPTGVTPSSAADATLLRQKLLESEAGTNNPYTALESYMRLSDMTTTRSNVFAVWVTVGYFEAEHFANFTAAQNAYTGKLGHIDSNDIFNTVYPDGYVLGAEKGLDNGTVKRHRAFYLIDRSTPVGFRRGDSSTNFKDVIVDSKILE